ncbi:secreted protein [Biscogniauxia mediterranea]|nr:secreted protein [Biscogniauxia mediterranea]
MLLALVTSETNKTDKHTHHLPTSSHGGPGQAKTMTFFGIPCRRCAWLACAVVVVVAASPSSSWAARLPVRRQSSDDDVSACKLAADPDVDLSAGFGFAADCVSSIGTMTASMIFVDFSDAPATEDSPVSLRDFFLPAAADWYATSSYGALSLNVTADTARFYRMPATAASYNWDRGLTAEAHEKYIQDAVDAYGGAGPPAADVLYVVPTANARAISFSPTYMGEVRARSGSEAIAKKAVTFGYDAYEAWGSLVLNHETGHTMCLPDYYPGDGRETGLWVGGWDLMGLISGPSPDYFAWDKWRLGWLADDQVDCVAAAGQVTSTHVLTPLEVADGGKKAVVVRRNNGTDVLVAEVRSARGLDAASCATTAGVLLYTVSTRTASGEGPVEVLDATPGSGGCAGDERNDATLTLGGTSSYAVPGWGVTVALTEVTDDGEQFTISVEVA